MPVDGHWAVDREVPFLFHIINRTKYKQTDAVFFAVIIITLSLEFFEICSVTASKI